MTLTTESKPTPFAQSLVTASDGTKLFVETWRGPHSPEAPHFFLCDGILCEGFIWKYLWGLLAELGPITHFHYRGHGRSGNPKNTNAVSIAQHAEDLMRVRESVGNPEAILLGHSMGSQVSLEEYHLFPEKIKSLLLFCGSYGKITSTFRGTSILEKILPKLTQLVDKNPNFVRALWARLPPELALKAGLKAGDLDAERINPNDVLPYLEHMVHMDMRLFLRMLTEAGEHTAEPYLHEIAVPVLVVAAEKDTFIPPASSLALAEKIPNAELLMIRNGSHAAPIEQPDIINPKVEAFLKQLLHLPS